MKKTLKGGLAKAIAALIIAIPANATDGKSSDAFVSKISKDDKGVVSSFTILYPKRDESGNLKIDEFVEKTITRVDDEYYDKGYIQIKIKSSLNFDKENGLLGAPQLNTKIASLGASYIDDGKERATLNKNIPEMKKYGIDRIYKIKLAAGSDPLTVCAELMNDPEIEYATPVYIRKGGAYTPNDMKVAEQYALKDLNLFEAWDITKGSTEVKIAIVDSGVDIKHEDLAANIWKNPKEEANGQDDDGNGKIDDVNGWDFVANTDANSLNQEKYTEDNDPTNLVNTHGTSVAGCASAVTNNLTGVAGAGFKCKIIPVKVGSDIEGAEGIYQGYEGLKYAATLNPDVINCSWGGPGYSPAEQDIVNYAVLEKKAALFVAAGNEASNIDQTPTYPASYENVFRVGANKEGKTPEYSFTNYGFSVNAFAPGYKVLLCDAGNKYTNESGTSFASPYVAGVAGLVKSVHRDWTPAQVYSQLRSTCDKNTNGDSLVYGAINAFKAVQYNNSSSSKKTIPGIEIESLGFVDNKSPLFINNDTRKIRLKIKNLLGAANNLKITCTSPDRFISFSDAPIVVGNLESMASKEIDVDVQLLENNPWSAGYAKLLINYEADGYSDFDYKTVTINVPTQNLFSSFLGGSSFLIGTKFLGLSAPNVNTTWGIFYNSRYRYYGYLKNDNTDLKLSYISTVPFTAIAALDSKTAYIGSSISNASRVLYTSNGASDWTSSDVSSITDNIKGLVVYDNNNAMLLGDPKNGKWGVAYTANHGTSWSQAQSLPAPKVDEEFVSGSLCKIQQAVWIGSNMGRILKSNSLGGGWNSINSGVSTEIVSIAFESSNVGAFIYLNGKNKALKATTNGGSSWDTPISNFAKLKLDPIKLFTLPDKKTYFILCSDGSIYSSSQDFTNWTPILSKRTDGAGYGEVFDGTNNTAVMTLLQPDFVKLQFKYTPGTAKPKILINDSLNIAFDTTVVNKTMSKQITIKNKGVATATISSINLATIDGAVTKDFSIVGDIPKTIAANNSAKITLQFNPTSAGDKKAKIVVVYNSETGNETMEIKGAAKPKPSRLLSIIDGEAINFDTVSVKSSITKDAKFKNISDTLIKVTKLEWIYGDNTQESEFKIKYNADSTLNASSTGKISIAFEPSAVGVKSAQLKVYNTGDLSPIIYQLKAYGKKDNTAVETENNKLTVTPNPAKDKAIISGISDPEAVRSVEIYNSVGELVYKLDNVKKYISDNKTLSMDLSSLNAGVYIAIVNMGDSMESFSIVIE
jgi:subtilisin family serine protease